MSLQVDDDIVTRLRNHAEDEGMLGNDWLRDVMRDGADEIERLRRLGDTMAYFLRSGEAKEMYSAVHAWEQARRG